MCKANGLYAHKPWQFHDVSALRGFENSVLSSPIIRKHIVPQSDTLCHTYSNIVLHLHINININIYIYIYIYVCVGMYVYMIHIIYIYIISENRI